MPHVVEEMLVEKFEELLQVRQLEVQNTTSKERFRCTDRLIYTDVNYKGVLCAFGHKATDLISVLLY